MRQRELQNQDWTIPHSPTGYSWDTVQAMLLMDLRDQLRTLNNVFRCHRFLDVPNKLERIARNTAKKRRKKK